MQITRQADYAVRAVYFLTTLGAENRASTSQIAADQRIPPSFLAKIISQLSVAGLLHTSRGARGGVSLAKDPDQLDLLDVVEAIDCPILLNECVADTSACTFSQDCPMRPVWCDAQKDLVRRLESTTFANFVNGRG